MTVATAETSSIKPTKTEDPFALTEDHLRDWLCGPYERFYLELERARQQMIKNKVPESLIKAHFFYDSDNVMLNHHRNFIEKSTNPKTWRLWTVESLSNDITPEQADAIRSQDNYRERPFYKIHQIRKVQDAQGKTWLTASFVVEALSRALEELGNTGLTINDSGTLGLDKLPRLSGRSVLSDPQNKNSRYVQVTTFNGLIPAGTFDQGVVKYTIPWSIETFKQLMQHAAEDVSLSFHKEGANIAVGATSPEQFITTTVEEAIKRETEFATRKNQPQSISLDDWENYQKYRSEKQAAKENNDLQYG
jgi:hypothetical protein